MRIYRIRRPPTKLLLIILAVVIIGFVPPLRLSLKNLTRKILISPLKAITGIKEYFAGPKNLSEENLRLKQRLASMSLSLMRAGEMARENERLAALLKFKKRLPHEAIVAKVIARDATDWRKSIIINKGKRHGVKEHMPIATPDGLAGRVVDVWPESSKAMLLTDPNSRVGVVLESSRESGVLVGFSGGHCKAIYLSLDSDIKKGERVLTAGFSPFFPKGLVVGEVVDTAVEITGLYKYAIVNPAVGMNKIEEIICIDARK